MPLAVVADNGGKRFELKSCEGAFVLLRQMTYGEWQRRSDLVSRISIESASPNKGRNAVRDLVQRVDTQSLEVALFEFKTCVVQHNLEDASGRTLQLGARQDLERLDPRIGREIGQLIDEMNSWDEEEEENFTSKPSNLPQPSTQVQSASPKA